MAIVDTSAIPAAGTFVKAWEFSANHLGSLSALATYDTGSPVLVDSAHPLPIAGAVTIATLPAITFAAPQHAIVDSGSVTVANPTDVSTLATEVTAAAVLAKLSADPATQTTLAAVLAKLVAAPALDATLTGGTQIAKIRPAPVTVYGGSATWPTAGQQIGSGPLSLLYIEATNSTGASIYVHVFDRATAPAGGDRPSWVFSSLISNGTTQPIAVGHSVYGFPCAVGAWVAFSSTLTTYTAIASTSVVVFNALYSA